MIVTTRHLPEHYARLQQAASVDDFFSIPFSGVVNAVWMPRTIHGDYTELARQLYLVPSWCEQMFEHNHKIRQRLEEVATHVGKVGEAARQVLADQDMVRARGLRVDFRLAGPDYYQFDVYAPHMDLGDPQDQGGTFSCGYTEPTTEWACNEDCVPAGRTREGVALFDVKPGAGKHHFAVGDIFRMAAQNNLSHVEGFVHWAPRTRHADGLRMMLMARYDY
ncbi:MAG: hypothetical protein NDJ24_06225 [Alphaproteobacteria bacterium]|nr:hypothetical protein [Alphaproteobacteria bacterium]